jgi:4-amino-4-deoxy-L-arabinose transferase-like glycosyltransferase
LIKQTKFNQDWEEADGPSNLWIQENWWISSQDRVNPIFHTPSDFHQAMQIIFLNRSLSLLFSLGSLILIFFIGYKLKGLGIGLISIILLSINPLFYQESHRSMSSSILLFFIILSFFYYLNYRQDKTIKTNLILGLVLGLTASTKLNGLTALVSVVTAEVIISIISFLRRSKNLLSQIHFVSIRIIILTLTTFIIFLLLNPFTWNDPINSIDKMYRSRIIQTIQFQRSHPKQAYYSIADRAKLIYITTISPEADFSNLIKINPFLDMILFVSGLIYAFARSFKGDQNKLILLLWFVNIFFIMCLYLLVGFDRYLLPIIPFITIIESLGAISIFKLLKSLLKFTRTNER